MSGQGIIYLEEKNTNDFWFEGWLNLTILDFFPIDTPEEGMTTNVIFASETTAEPLARILCEKLKKENVKQLAFMGFLDPIIKEETVFGRHTPLQASFDSFERLFG